MLIPLIFWSSLMLVLVIATMVVALKEKKAAQKARASLAPQPLGEDPAMGLGDSPADGQGGFGEDGFGEDGGFGDNDGFGEVDSFGEIEELK